MEGCLFCKIVKGEIPSQKVYEDELIFAFHDINPARPMHILVIPKKHLTSLAHAGKEDEQILGRMLSVSQKLAVDNGSADGFRNIINTGRIGMQEVMHLHMHLVGGPEPVGPMLKKV